MDTQATIAVVEDDPDIRDLVTRYLEGEGHRVLPCGHGQDLDRILDSAVPDLVILDLMMPGEDGLSICRRLRATMDLPVIILSARGDEIDRIVGLEIGADDYLAKPFNPRELSARVKAVLRRRAVPSAQAQPAASEGDADRDVLYFDGWCLDVDTRSLTDADREPVMLSGGEFALLLAFARHPRRTLTRDQLLDWTRGNDAAPVDRAIDVQLSRLRRKLRDDPRNPRLIKTVRGDGYFFAANVTRSAGAGGGTGGTNGEAGRLAGTPLP